MTGRMAKVYTGSRFVWREAPWSEGLPPTAAELRAATRKYMTVSERKALFERDHGRLDTPATSSRTPAFERKTRSDGYASYVEAETEAKRRGGRRTIRRVGNRWEVS